MMTGNAQAQPAATPAGDAGIRIENLDKTADPAVDFYQYACGGWMKTHPLTGEYSRFGSFDMLAENNREQLKSLIEEIAGRKNEPGTVAQKIGDLYNLAMDSTRRNAEGVAPLKPWLDRVGAIKDKKELSTFLPELMLIGIDPFFSVYVEADVMDSKRNLFGTYQGGLSLGERDYYLENDESTTKVREAFKAHVVKMFEMFGYSKADARKRMEDVMRIETRLARSHFDKVKRRDPYANYHKMPVSGLQKLVPNIDWTKFLATLKVDIKELSVSQEEPMKEVSKVIAAEPLSAIKSYLEWKLIDNAASSLSDEVYALNFDFYGRVLSGKTEMQPRWKRAQGSVSGGLGEAVGELYVAKYFPPEAKERMVNLVHNLQKAYAARIEKLDWMSAETKQRALEKLNAFYVKIGYPDKWKDYSPLEIKPEETYLANMDRVSRFAVREMLDKATKPVDPDDERDLLPGRHPAIPLLRHAGRRRLQLRRYRRCDRSRDDARIRRSGSPVRQGRQPKELVDGSRREEVQRARQGDVRLLRQHLRSARSTRQRQVHTRRNAGRLRRFADRLSSLQGGHGRPAARG